MKAHTDKDLSVVQLTIKEGGALAVLALQGDLEQRHAAALKACLRQSIDSVGRIILNCESVTGIDAACLQVICSAYRLSQTLRRDFSLSGHRPELFLCAIRSTQYVHCAGCGLDCDKGCFWGVN